MNMHASNLYQALALAVEHQTRADWVATGHNLETSQVSGWRQVMEAMRRGEGVVIIPHEQNNV